MGVRGVPAVDQQADPEPGVAGHGISQTDGAASPPRPGWGRPGGVNKNFPARLDEIAAKQAAGTSIGIWWQDEARIGQTNKITRPWAKRGTRPSPPHDQRTKSPYLFGAICPALGKGAGLVLPFCNTAAMAMHLKKISHAVAPGAHAVVLLDRAGWHLSADLVVPDNITIMPLPSKCPELNPVENIWQSMRDNWLSSRVPTWATSSWPTTLPGGSKLSRA